MMPEEKLKHLKDYLFWKIDESTRIINIMELFGSTGILIYDRSGYAPKTFENYLNDYIQKQL